MSVTIELSADLELSLRTKARTQGTTEEAFALHALETADEPERDLLEVLREIWSDLSPEELAKLPVDGASQHDHYIYGTPKRDV